MRMNFKIINEFGRRNFKTGKATNRLRHGYQLLLLSRSTVRKKKVKQKDMKDATW